MGEEKKKGLRDACWINQMTPVNNRSWWSCWSSHGFIFERKNLMCRWQQPVQRTISTRWRYSVVPSAPFHRQQQQQYTHTHRGKKRLLITLELVGALLCTTTTVPTEQNSNMDCVFIVDYKYQAIDAGRAGVWRRRRVAAALLMRFDFRCNSPVTLLTPARTNWSQNWKNHNN